MPKSHIEVEVIQYVMCVSYSAERLLGTTCDRYPTARCRNELCGGCVARHYVDNREVHCGTG